jgi:hypothetical protein
MAKCYITLKLGLNGLVDEMALRELGVAAPGAPDAFIEQFHAEKPDLNPIMSPKSQNMENHIFSIGLQLSDCHQGKHFLLIFWLYQ